MIRRKSFLKFRQIDNMKEIPSIDVKDSSNVLDILAPYKGTDDYIVISYSHKNSSLLVPIIAYLQKE